ncbi:type IV pilin protein [Piscinibacter koreensis]|uniref:Prepilin-type N-terminal cleavage/methylation domain-containing protein n=1 Tax=Piscinibacter koreensis TaxID=2742824 RepID=A0A7Y6TW58_9BURK|nr:prepilin-type N-terminal cleavage/methylation domain-containing protein [Schlegelella koreensis]NUZ05779.1 prepilin-type N-terminal cleavage/methylation domain-containing protein [Schlegelella koreensis]
MRLPAFIRRRLERGLTVIELMIVLILVAVLAAIALPSYGKYRDRIRSAQATTDIGTMSTLIELYARDNRELPETLEQVGLASKLDPWGRAYRYYKIAGNPPGPARKDRRLSPINSDFDLYSVGPDGVTHKQVSNRDSADDIIRGSNGKFVGRGADF